MFVYKPKFDTLQLEKVKNTDYVLSWKLKKVHAP